MQNKIKVNKQMNLSKSRQKIDPLLNNVNESMYDSITDGTLLVINHQKKAKSIISQVNTKISQLINQGEIQISSAPIQYPITQHTNEYLLGLNLSINLLNKNLRQFSESLLQQKQQQKQQHKQKQIQAKQFVKKMQKQKQEFHQKIKHKKSQSRLYVRAYSQDTIRMMNQKLQSRIAQKKRELEEKIINIKKRTIDRGQDIANKEISYWDKVKNIQSSRSMSTDRLLPVLHSRSNQRNLLSKNPQKSQSSRYQSNIDKVNKNLMKAKLKLKKFQQNYKSTQVQSLNRIEKIIEKNRQLQLNIDTTNKNNAFALKYSNNRFKIIGNEYLKHSLKKIDPFHAQKSILKASKTQSQQLNLQVNASYLKPMQNPYKSSLVNSWEQTLMKIQTHQIPKLRGLDLLSSIQKKLNKFDPNGITLRLRQKVKVIDNVDRKPSPSNNSTIFNNFNGTSQSNQLVQPLSPFLSNKKQKMQTQMSQGLQNQFM